MKALSFKCPACRHCKVKRLRTLEDAAGVYGVIPSSIIGLVIYGHNPKVYWCNEGIWGPYRTFIVKPYHRKTCRKFEE